MEKKISDDYFDFMLKKALDDYADEEGGRLATESNNLEEPVLSSEYKKNIDKIARKLELSKNKFYMKILNTKFKIAIIFFIVLFSGSILTYNVNADLKSFINKLFTKTDTHIDITYNKSNINYDFSKISESWKYIYIPEYIPNGYRVKEISSTDEWIDIVYYMEEKEIDFTQFKDDVSYSIDNEYSDISEIKILGNIGYLQHHKNLTVIYWNNGDMLFNISGNIGDEELIKIVKSIYLVGR